MQLLQGALNAATSNASNTAAGFSSTSISSHGQFWSDVSFASMISAELAKAPMQHFTSSKSSDASQFPMTNVQANAQTQKSGEENEARISTEISYASQKSDTSERADDVSEKYSENEKVAKQSEKENVATEKNRHDANEVAEAEKASLEAEISAEKISSISDNDDNGGENQKIVAKVSGQKNAVQKSDKKIDIENSAVNENATVNLLAAEISAQENQEQIDAKIVFENSENVEIDAAQMISADSGNAELSGAQNVVLQENKLLKAEQSEDVAIAFAENVIDGEHESAVMMVAAGENDSGASQNFFGKKENSRAQKLDADGKITVTDLRTHYQTHQQADAKNANAQNAVTANAPQKIVTADTSSTIEMSLNLMQHAEQNILSQNTQVASADGSDFHAMLKNQIQQNAHEFVKAGSIVLRDNNVGTINLTLNPEKLGNVKISLQLSDKLIAGQITAFSREAYSAFKESVESLKQAFIASGFEMGELDVAWSGQNMAGQFAEGQKDESNQFAAAQTYGDYVSSEADENVSMSEWNSYDSYAVNVTA